ncbi:hypothetical protein H8B06_12465 [Sphingobacterium sp. DN00404]|uniref:Uncharacterized protein n=1 Tax=Sphingobacterium micropteri TaxID=2763501 RepID=A0ABR7YQM0_9SPHI|nr:hypothetical protein [Sphingobacterium micropteri]MBD1433644.1 hypothetical protein [Sphingobacterium micropteri]
MGKRVKSIYAVPAQVVTNIIINTTSATIVMVVYGVLLMTSSFQFSIQKTTKDMPYFIQG